MIIHYEGMTCISLNMIKYLLKTKRKYSKFCKCSIGSTRPIIPKKEVKIPKPDEWVYLCDFNKFIYLDKQGK